MLLKFWTCVSGLELPERNVAVIVCGGLQDIWVAIGCPSCPICMPYAHGVARGSQMFIQLMSGRLLESLADRAWCWSWRITDQTAGWVLQSRGRLWQTFATALAKLVTCDECSQMVTSDGERQGKGIKGIDSALAGWHRQGLSGFHNCLSSGSARNRRRRVWCFP